MEDERSDASVLLKCKFLTLTFPSILTGPVSSFIHILLAAMSYYEMKTQTSQSKAVVLSQDEEERLLFDEESVSHR